MLHRPRNHSRLARIEENAANFFNSSLFCGALTFDCVVLQAYSIYSRVTENNTFQRNKMSTLFGKSNRKRTRNISTTDPELPTAENENVDLSEDALGNDAKEEVEEDEDTVLPSWAAFEDLGLAEPLVATCRQLGFKKPSPVQRTIIPFLLKENAKHILALAATGSGKTAAFVLPILHRLSVDPYGIYAVILTPTRELAKQIHQQVLALGTAYNIQSALVVGGLDSVRQSCELDRRPHFCVATPGRLAELLRGPSPPRLQYVRYMVLDEADRLLASNSGFERDVAELLLHCTSAKRDRHEQCQTLLFSATMTRSLESVEELAGAGGRLPLKKFIIREGVESTDKVTSKKLKTEGADGDAEEGDREEVTDITSIPKIPAGLKQEYLFMPSRVRDAYLLTTIRTLMSNGGRANDTAEGSGWTASSKHDEDDDEASKARSAIVFVSTCERAALVSGILTNVGVDNVALHSMLSQNRRLASLGKFKSQQVRVLVATDVASRGLDIPTVDLIINCELPRNAVSYVHRVGRTARAGRRGRAVSLVSEADVALVHAAEKVSGRSLEKCEEVTDDMAIKMLGPVAKAARLTKMKLMEIGFDDLVKKFKERKTRDKAERARIEHALRKTEA
jgi:ATP-dependent RNA helicase DDX49/DBP8